MKKITLYASSTRNSGAFVDAGTTVTIGDAEDAIGTDRAKALVDDGRAASETAAKAEATASPAADA